MKIIFILFTFLTFGLVAEDKIILGSGRWTFEFMPNAIQLPAKHAKGVQDYHGVAVDSQGRAYVGYYSKNGNSETRAIARFNYDPNSKTPFVLDRFIGDSSWVKDRLHGLNIVRTHHGDERLLVVYNKQQVILCDLDGRIDIEHTFKIRHKEMKKGSDGHKSPHSETLGVYDGYATNVLHELNLDGTKTGHSHGKKGTGLDHTNTAHGMGVDPKGNLVIADRGNKRLVWRQPDLKPLKSKKNPGKHVQLATPGLEVCNVQFQKDYAVLPCLNSRIAFLKKSEKEECGFELESSFAMPKDLVKQGFDGIHDVNFSIDGKYLIVAVWQRNRKIPPRLFALKKVSEKSK